MLKGRWAFGHHSGAVLMVYKPRQISLNPDIDPVALASHPLLKGKKVIVKDIWKCPAYAMCLTTKGSCIEWLPIESQTLT